MQTLSMFLSNSLQSSVVLSCSGSTNMPDSILCSINISFVYFYNSPSTTFFMSSSVPPNGRSNVAMWYNITPKAQTSTYTLA